MTTIRQDDFIASIADAFQYISYYHPADFIKAMAAAYEALLLAEVEADYPSDLNSLALTLNYDRGSAQASGFATPSTKLSGAGGKKKRSHK